MQLSRKSSTAPMHHRHYLSHSAGKGLNITPYFNKPHAFCTTLESLLPHLQPGCPRVQDVARGLRELREDLLKYLQNLFVTKQQPPATHVLAILVSEDSQNNKPYAIPVQFVPYSSIRDQYIRDLTAIVKTVMVKMDLKPVRVSYFSFTL